MIKITLYSLCIVIAILTACLGLRSHALDQLDQEIQWLKEKGYPTTPQQLDDFCAKFVPNDNAANDLLKIFESFNQNKKLNSELENMEPFGVTYDVVNNNFNEYEAAIDQCELSFRNLDQITGKRKCFFGVNLDDDLGIISSPVGINVLFTSKMLERRALFQLVLGNSNAAMEGAMHLFVLGDFLEFQPNLLDQSLRCYIHSQAFNVISETCLYGSPSEQSLITAINILERTSSGNKSFVLALHGERVQFLNICNKLKEHEINYYDKYLTIYNVPLFATLLTLDKSYFLKNIRLAEETSKSDYTIAIETFKENIDTPPSFYLLSNLLSKNYRTLSNGIIAKHQAVLRLSAICLQLSLSKMKGVEYNTSLSTMPEDLLIDPFSMNKFNFHQINDRLLVSSVGPNLKYDKGLNENRETDDLSFQLYTKNYDSDKTAEHFNPAESQGGARVPD